jgi:hypothetical protein
MMLWDMFYEKLLLNNPIYFWCFVQFFAKFCATVFVKQYRCWSAHADAIASCFWYEIDDLGFESLDVSPTQPPSYSVGTGGYFPEGKEAVAWN